MNQPRHYRDISHSGLACHRLVHGETDLALYLPPGIWDERLAKALSHVIVSARAALQQYIGAEPLFASSHRPLPLDAAAPPIARSMMEAASAASVGPMAAVAGAFAALAGEFLLRHTDRVMVENGGDLFLAGPEPRIIGVYAGEDNPFTGRLGIKLSAEQMPCGVCTSSGTVGRSFSYGRADAAVIVARDAALADAAATAAGNMVKSAGDLAGACDFAISIAGVDGALLICGEQMAAAGNIELCQII